MAQFSVTLNFDGAQVTREQANEKLQAFFIMANSLSHDDLLTTAYFIADNPEAINTIKRWITDPPPALKVAHKMLFKKKA